jgi:hypothetical protein
VVKKIDENNPYCTDKSISEVKMKRNKKAFLIHSKTSKF